MSFDGEGALGARVEEVSLELVHVGDYVSFATAGSQSSPTRCVLSKAPIRPPHTDRVAGWQVELAGADLSGCPAEPGSSGAASTGSAAAEARAMQRLRGMMTTVGQLIATLFDHYERAYGDEHRAALATQRRVHDVLGGGAHGVHRAPTARRRVAVEAPGPLRSLVAGVEVDPAHRRTARPAHVTVSASPAPAANAASTTWRPAATADASERQHRDDRAEACGQREAARGRPARGMGAPRAGDRRRGPTAMSRRTPSPASPAWANEARNAGHDGQR